MGGTWVGPGIIGRLSHGCCGMRFELVYRMVRLSWVNSKSCACLGWKKGAGCFNKERGWFTWSKGVVLVEIISISRFLWPKKLTKSGFPLGETIRKTFFEPSKRPWFSVSIYLSAETACNLFRQDKSFFEFLWKKSTFFSCRHFWILRFAHRIGRWRNTRCRKKNLGSGDVWIHKAQQILGPVTLPNPHGSVWKMGIFSNRIIKPFKYIQPFSTKERWLCEKE